MQQELRNKAAKRGHHVKGECRLERFQGKLEYMVMPAMLDRLEGYNEQWPIGYMSLYNHPIETF